MPGQSPAGRSGAAAPRDQPAPPPNGDGAPPPAKQGSAGAEGAEIARPTDSTSEGPRPSDSLADAVRTTSGTVSSGDEYDNIGQYGLGYYSVVDDIGNNKVGREV